MSPKLNFVGNLFGSLSDSQVPTDQIPEEDSAKLP